MNAVTIAKKCRDGIWSLHVPCCPLCGCEHHHGGGDGAKPLFGERLSHCMIRGEVRGYTLIETPPVGGAK